LTDADYLVDNSTPDREDSFVMDSLGNRTGDQTLSDETVNFTVQASTNRYTSIGGNSITHDDAGNLTVDRQGYVYFYDYENRVVKIEDSSNNDVAEYAYDALGRRIRMIDKAADPDVTTLYYRSPDRQDR
jgi:YD repeat-containing protein